MFGKDQSFTLPLSSAELGWLAGVFGQTRLVLPKPISAIMGETLTQAQESLAGRRLIQREPGTGWKVDQLAAFLVQWLGTVEEFTRLEVHRRGKEPVQAGVYARQGLILLAECDAQAVTFVFLPDEAYLMAEISRFLELGSVRRGRDTFAFPEPAELVQAAWQDPVPTRRLLERSDLSERDVSAALAWIDSLKMVVQFTHVSTKVEKPYCLFSDGQSAWEFGPSGELAGVTMKGVAAQIQQILYN